jgi:hypothetical protein
MTAECVIPIETFYVITVIACYVLALLNERELGCKAQRI